MTAPLFLADAAVLAPLQVGDHLTLDGDEGRHARVVQRRQVGELLDVSDGHGLRLRCVIDALPENAKSALDLQIQERIAEPAAEPRITLVQALAKGDHSEMAITTAVETGVDAVIPWQADRSIVVWRGDRAVKSAAKWTAAVTAAAKQSRRAWIPPVEAAVNSDQLAALVRQVSQNGGTALVLDAAGDMSLSAVPLPNAGQILIIVGPEGGISDAELTALNAAGAISVRLGPEIMRSSTAGPVAVAIIAMRLGRWEQLGS